MPPVTQEQINKDNLSLKDISIQNATPKSEAGTVSANDLANPPAPAPVTGVTPPTLPNNGMVSGVLGSIKSASENAKRLQEEQANFQSFADESSGFDIQNEQLQRFGVTPDKLSRLEDIQLQLAGRNTDSALTQSRIQEGNSLAQGGREVTQEQRENAIRNSGLAAEAAVLSGNIETGRALANDAVNIAMQDRTFKANAKLQEISDLKDVVGEETRQLLVQEERKYTAELAQIERVKTAVDAALASGAATADDVKAITNPKLSDEERLSLAQAIVSRGAGEMRDLDMAAQRASIANSYSAINDRKERLKLAQDAVTQTEEQALAEGKTVNEAKSEKALGMLASVNELANHPGFQNSVGTNFIGRGWNPFDFVQEQFTGNSSEFKSEVDRLANTLTLENMDMLKGPATDKDVEIVAASMSRLKNMDVSEDAYAAELARLYDAADRIVQNVGITPEQALYYGAATPEDLTEFNNYFDGTGEETQMISNSVAF